MNIIFESTVHLARRFCFRAGSLYLFISFIYHNQSSHISSSQQAALSSQDSAPGWAAPLWDCRVTAPGRSLVDVVLLRILRAATALARAAPPWDCRVTASRRPLVDGLPPWTLRPASALARAAPPWDFRVTASCRPLVDGVLLCIRCVASALGRVHLLCVGALGFPWPCDGASAPSFPTSADFLLTLFSDANWQALGTTFAPAGASLMIWAEYGP